MEADGKTLVFRQAYITILVVSARRLLQLSQSQSGLTTLYHRAHKKVEHVDIETYKQVAVTKENAWKFELFLHDLVPLIPIDRIGVLECDRKVDYSPVKNADSESVKTPATARRDLMAECGTWMT